VICGAYFLQRPAAMALAAAMACAAGCAGGAADSSMARVVRVSDDVQASLHEHHGVVLVDLHSRSGMGTAAFDFASPARGARFVLHTAGLEQFRMAFADVVVELAVAQDGSLRQSAVQGHGAARPLEARDPLWMPVRVVRADRGGVRSAGTLESVEIETPPAFESAVPGRCTVNWIDFFR
jgi:hypothetical protein